MMTPTLDNCLIRPLETADWPLYRELRLSALKESPLAFGSSAEVESEQLDQEWQARLGKRPGSAFSQVFGAFMAGQAAVGLAGVYVKEGDFSTAHVYSVWVDPEARRKGVGQALIEFAEKMARRWGCSRLELGVAEDNAPAMTLYRRLGFASTGRWESQRKQPEKRLLYLVRAI